HNGFPSFASAPLPPTSFLIPPHASLIPATIIVTLGNYSGSPQSYLVAEKNDSAVTANAATASVPNNQIVTVTLPAISDFYLNITAGTPQGAAGTLFGAQVGNQFPITDSSFRSMFALGQLPGDFKFTGGCK